MFVPQIVLVLGLFASGCASVQIPLLASPSTSHARWRTKFDAVSEAEPPESRSDEKPQRNHPAFERATSNTTPVNAAKESPSLETPTGKGSDAPTTPATAITRTIRGTVTSVPARAASSAVVYLEKGPASHEVDGVIDNKQLAFIPHVLVITAGGKVEFVNNDPFPHNVFSPDHEKFDLGALPPKGKKSRVFKHVGAYTLLCNIHPNMKAYLVVSPSSYFSKTDKEGSFEIADVPEGTYKITAWAPGVKPATQTVTVKGDATVNFALRRK